MESAILGLVLDSSVLIAAERRKLTAAKTIEDIRQAIGEVPVVLSAVTVAEIGHAGNPRAPAKLKSRMANTQCRLNCEPLVP